MQFSFLDLQLPCCDGQIESSGAGAAWVDVEDSIFLFYFWVVAVAVDYCGYACGLGLEVEAGEIVEQVDGCAFGFDEVGFGQGAGPGLGVDVAADCGDRGNLFEGGEDFGGADVAGVEDAVGAREGGEGFGAEQAVGVGDEAEEHRH